MVGAGSGSSTPARPTSAASGGGSGDSSSADAAQAPATTAPATAPSRPSFDQRTRSRPVIGGYKLTAPARAPQALRGPAPQARQGASAIVIRRLADTKNPEYELVLMLDPEAPEERRAEIAADAKKRIESGGSLKHDSVWGMRKMAYEIEQRTEADYRFYRFQAGDPPLLEELNHNLKIADGVLRFRIFKVDPRTPVIVPGPPTPLAAPGGPPRGGRRDGRGRGRRDEEDRPAAPQPPAPPPAEAAAPPAEAPPAAEPTPPAAAEPPAPEPAAEPPAPEAPEAPPEAAADAPPHEPPAEQS
jgi:small subunit ribosomal protein S6